MDDITRRTMDAIIRHGHQVVAVLETPEDEPEPGWSPHAYTVGRTTKERPELLVTGALSPSAAGTILNSVARIDDETPVAAGTELPPGTVLPDYPVRLVAADPFAAEMLQALNLFGSEVRALQVLWPDREGRFPDDPDFADPATQPTYPPEE